MRETWRLRFRMMETQGEEAEVMIYGGLANDKFWDDDVTPTEFDKALKAAKAGGAKRLNLRVNSGGGEVFAAVAMRSMVINAGFDAVRVMIEGLCASAATLFATIPGARVVIADGSEFMIHNPMTLCWGNSADIEKEVQHLRQMEDTFSEMYADRSGQEKEQIRAWMDEETWFTARAAVEAGFCDELQENAAPMAACVTGREMAAMRAIYRRIPEDIREIEEPKDVSTGTPVAGAPTEIQPIIEEEDQGMDIKELTQDQLRAENPALFAAICDSAVSEERARIEDIDALTLPGFEAQAAEAKRTGMSAMDFQKSVVAACRAKPQEFLQAREKETAAAASVSAGRPEDHDEGDEAELNAYAKSMSEYAKQAKLADSGMF